ncbi:hypothetical protein AC629_36710 [Bradyrhizobium sp. NAS80.1]|nr:hypothetical protein AC629_36710 [Bradyrhizobium sp. NAS80.1]
MTQSPRGPQLDRPCLALSLAQVGGLNDDAKFVAGAQHAGHQLFADGVHLFSATLQLLAATRRFSPEL